MKREQKTPLDLIPSDPRFSRLYQRFVIRRICMHTHAHIHIQAAYVCNEHIYISLGSKPVGVDCIANDFGRLIFDGVVRAETNFEISAPSAPLSNSATTSTLIAHCKREDEAARKTIGHLPAYIYRGYENEVAKHFIPMAALEL